MVKGVLTVKDLVAVRKTTPVGVGIVFVRTDLILVEIGETVAVTILVLAIVPGICQIAAVPIFAEIKRTSTIGIVFVRVRADVDLDSVLETVAVAVQQFQIVLRVCGVEAVIHLPVIGDPSSVAVPPVRIGAYLRFLAVRKTVAVAVQGPFVIFRVRGIRSPVQFDPVRGASHIRVVV